MCRDLWVLGPLNRFEYFFFPSSLTEAISWISHFRAEGSSKIQARMEQQPARPPQPPQPPPPPPPMPFRAPTKPPVGPKTSPLKDNPSPEPQLDDIKRGKQHFLENSSNLEWDFCVFVAFTRLLYWHDSMGIFCHWNFCRVHHSRGDAGGGFCLLPHWIKAGFRNSDWSCGCLAAFCLEVQDINKHDCLLKVYTTCL